MKRDISVSLEHRIISGLRYQPITMHGLSRVAQASPSVGRFATLPCEPNGQFNCPRSMELRRTFFERLPKVLQHHYFSFCSYCLIYLKPTLGSPVQLYRSTALVILSSLPIEQRCSLAPPCQLIAPPSWFPKRAYPSCMDLQ